MHILIALRPKEGVNVSLFMLCALLFVSCRPVNRSQQCVVPCTTREYRLSLENYNAADVDTIMVRTFDAGNGSTNMQSQMQYVASDDIRAEISVYNKYDGFTLNEGTDYEIIVPALSDTFRISDIVLEQNTGTTTCDGKSRGPVCYNYMSAHATLNGHEISTRTKQTFGSPVDMYLLLAP